ncbi:hypothetical protein ACYSNO_08380 [Enterococcus sp. LJL98]
MRMGRIFKKSVTDLENGTPAPRPKEDLTPTEKKQLFLRTKMYILLQEVLEEFQQFFDKDEEIVGSIPLTNEENSVAATAGINGMLLVKTPQGKDYLKTFHELRGHRLLIFTNKKIYFMVVLEFIEEKKFYTYEYHAISRIKFKKETRKYREWQSLTQSTKEETISYTFDFQAGGQVFTEIFTPEEGEKFLAIRKKIPQLQAIELSNHVTRDSLFDYIFSNVHFSIRTFTILSWLFFGGLFLYFLFIVLQVYFFPNATQMPQPSQLFDLSTPLKNWSPHKFFTPLESLILPFLS